MEALAHERAAVATALQQHDTRKLVWPRFIESRRETNTSIKVPGTAASLATRALYKGFLALRVPHTLEQGDDFLKLTRAEDVELRAAADGRASPDGSAPPRRASLVVLLNGGSATGADALRALDALAHFSRYFGRIVRCTLLAGTDAARYAKATDRDAISVHISWHDGERQTCTRALSLDYFESLQHSLFKAKHEHGAPIPDEVVATKPHVEPNCWCTLVKEASNAFFATMTAEDSTTLSIDLKDISTTGVFVRFVPRHMGVEGMRDPLCFHGMLLSKTDAVTSIRETLGMLDAMPIDAIDSNDALHTAATQVVCRHLDADVSLFAYGNAGMPIQSPRSWIYQFCTAIVPIDQVLPNFLLFPCTQESILPRDPVLANATVELMQRSSTLVSGLRRDPVLVRAPRIVSPSPRPSEEETPAIAAFGISTASSRFTLGDAHLHLMSRTTREVEQFIKHASLKWGTSKTLNDALGLAAEMIDKGETSNARATIRDKDRARLKRTCDASLRLFQEPKCARTRPPTLRSDRFQHFLGAIGAAYDVKTNTDALLETGSFTGFLQSVLTILGVSEDGCVSETLGHASQVMHELHEPGKSMLKPLAAAVHILANHDAPRMRAFVFNILPTKRIEAYRVLESGQLKLVGPGTVMDADPDTRALFLCGPKILATMKNRDA